MIRGPVIDWARMDHTFFSLTNDLQKFVSLIMQSPVSPVSDWVQQGHSGA